MKITLLNPLEVEDKIILNHKNKLETMDHEFYYYKDFAKDNEEVVRRLKDADIAIVTNKPLTGAVIDQLENLEMIDVAFTGVDHIDLEAVKNNGITLLNASGYSDDSVAELVIGLILAVMRRFPANRENIFENADHKLMGEELRGKTVGVIGTGNIGIKLIGLLQAFGCDVIAHSRTEKDSVKDMGVDYVDLDTLLSKSDVISLHIPNNDETKNFLSKEELDKIKENAILINCARGPVIDNDYLAELLNEDKLRAGIDVFDMEPPLPEDYPLRNAKNVILTNHVGFYTKEAMEKRAEIVFENIYKYLAGETQNEISL